MILSQEEISVIWRGRETRKPRRARPKRLQNKRATRDSPWSSARPGIKTYYKSQNKIHCNLHSFRDAEALKLKQMQKKQQEESGAAGGSK